MKITPASLSECLKTVSVVALSTAVCAALAQYMHPRNLLMIYLMGVLFVALRYSLIASILACLLSVTAFDYLFVTPPFHLNLLDREYFITIGSMVFVAVLVSSVESRMKQATADAREGRRSAEVISEFTRGVVAARTLAALPDLVQARFQTILGWRARLLLAAPRGESGAAATSNATGAAATAGGADECKLAAQAADHKSTITSTHPPSLYLPLLSGTNIVGVLAVYVHNKEELNQKNRDLISALAEQITLVIDRLTSLENVEKAKLQVEGMKIRNALLSSVSHDLRTPLSAIMGAASSILADESDHMREVNRELVQSVYHEADRLNNFLRNLLDMTRIESGAVRLKKEWNSLEESVGVALGRLRKNLETHKVVTDVPEDLPLILYDEQLIDQVLTNLIENAAKYAANGTEIKIWARLENVIETGDGRDNSEPAQGKHCQSAAAVFGVSNSGCALPAGAEAQMFDKFYRGESNASTVYGAGLGLTICRGIMQAHGGQIYAQRFGQDGISICCCLPMQGEPPAIQKEQLEEAH